MTSALTSVHLSASKELVHSPTLIPVPAIHNSYFCLQCSQDLLKVCENTLYSQGEMYKKPELGHRNSPHK